MTEIFNRRNSTGLFSEVTVDENSQVRVFLLRAKTRVEKRLVFLQKVTQILEARDSTPFLGNKNMLEFLAHLIVTAALLLIVANFVKGITINGWGSAILLALVLGLVNAFIRPIMTILTLPITILTLGLFLLVVNALMFWLASAFVPGTQVQKFSSAFWGSLLFSVLNLLIYLLTGQRA